MSSCFRVECLPHNIGNEPGVHAAGEHGHVQPLCALYVLERLLHVVNNARLVNFLAAAMLLGGPPPRHSAAAPALGLDRVRGDAAAIAGAALVRQLAIGLHQCAGNGSH